MTKRKTREEIEQQVKQAQADWAALKAKLMQEEFIDDDGYPTAAALELIENWHFSEIESVFEFIKDIWHMRSWGWSEVDASELPADDDDYDKDGGKLYFISTAGWSGNESLLRALEENWMAWSLCWVQSRRGGHHIFRQYKLKDDE